MKRTILSLILCCALLFSLAACGKTEAPQPPAGAGTETAPNSETPAAADKNTNKAASTAHKSLDFFTITSHAAETAVKLPDGIRPIRFIHMPREKKICPRLYAGAHICHKF